MSIPEEKREEDLPKYGKKVLSVPLSCCALKPDKKPMELLDFEKCVGNDSQVINQKVGHHCHHHHHHHHHRNYSLIVILTELMLGS